MNRFYKELLSGSFYIGVAKYSNIFFQLIVTAVLARLLTPADFGVVAIATVFIVFFNILSDIGIGPAIIQNKELSENDINNLYTFNLYMGGLLCVLFYFLAWPISSFYSGDKEVFRVCQILSLLIFFTCIRTVPINLLYRDKLFKFISLSTLLIQIVVGVVSIIMAYNGFGVYSLVIPQVCSSILQAFVFSYKYHLSFEKDFFLIYGTIKKIFSYSIFSFLSSVVYYFSRNLDKLLIGKYISPIALGYYEKSYRLMFIPIDNITFVITPVLHPLFSNYQSDKEEVANKYLKIVCSLAYLSAPLSVFLCISAKEIVLLMFGDQWYKSVPTFSIMALSVSVQMLTTTVGAIYNAVNATQVCFKTACISTVLMVSGFITTIVFWGTIEAVSIGFLVSQTIFFFVNYAYLMKVLECSYTRFLMVLKKPVGYSLLLYAFYYLAFSIVTIDNLLVSLLVKSVFFLLFLLLLFSLVEKSSMKIVINMLRNHRTKN